MDKRQLQNSFQRYLDKSYQQDFQAKGYSGSHDGNQEITDQKITGHQIDWSKLTLEPQIRHLAKGEHLFQQGESAANLYFLCYGLVRYVSLSEEGKEFTQSFAAAPRIVGSTRAMVRQSPALFSIEVLEDALVLEYPWAEFYQQMSQCPNFLLTYIHLLEQLFIGKEERENALVKHSAERRYLDFISQFSDLEKRIPLQYIASYIGITPVALSRIRNRLKQQ